MRAWRYLIFICLLAVAVFAVAHFACGEASADTHVWDGGGADVKASTIANWNVIGGPADTVPVVGDDIVFNVTSTKACTWDLALEVGNFSMLSGYTGTITPTSPFSVYKFTMIGGTLTGSTLGVVTVRDDFVYTSGTITASKLCLIATGTNKNITMQGVSLQYFRCAGDINFLSTSASVKFIIIDTGKTLTMANGCTMTVYNTGTSGVGLINNGTIVGVGTGAFNIQIKAMDIVGKIGHISCPVTIFAASTLNQNRYFNTTDDTILDSTLNIYSSSTSYSFTLNTLGYDLIADKITIGTRGVILGQSSNISCNGWDSSAGTWIPGTSTVNIPDTNKTIKLASGQSFYQLNIVGSHTSPKVTIIGISGSVSWNFTTLDSGRAYNYYVDDEWVAVYIAPVSGILGFSYSTWSTHTFELREAPLITPAPSDISLDELIHYSQILSADQAVTWSLSTTAEWLSIDVSTVSGTPDSFDGGVAYVVNVTVSNVNGNDSVEWTITVADSFNSIVTSSLNHCVAGHVYVYNVDTDKELLGDGMTYSISTDCDELSIDSSTGVIRSLVTDVGVYNVQITVTDEDGKSDIQTFTFMVLEDIEHIRHGDIDTKDNGEIRWIVGAIIGSFCVLLGIGALLLNNSNPKGRKRK